MLVDTHCHLDHPSLFSRLDEVLAAARRRGVGMFVIPGVSPGDWPLISRLASEELGVFSAFGLHPALANRYHEGLLDELSRYAGSGVAIGEIGLDYALAEVPRDVQAAALRGQLRIAVRMGLPVLIHCRRAFQDLLRIVREERVSQVGGVMHAFSGSLEMAREFSKEGLLVSISGTVTYRNAVRLPEIAARIPLECMVLETDAPDMAPEPYRDRVNEPAFLVEIARRVAEIRGIPMEELAAVTTANARRLLSLS